MAILPKSLSYSNLSFEFRKRFIGFDVPSEPHFDPKSVDFFKGKMAAAKFYLEFGSGGSTVLAAKSGKRGFSVDSDRFFLRDVNKKIKGTSHQMKLYHADVGSTGLWGRPKDQKHTRKNLERWRNYVEAPFRDIGDDFYDLILVDGRWRVACAMNTLREGAARKATFTLLFDDYKRKAYHKIEQFAEVTQMAGRMAAIEVVDGQMLKVPEPEDISRMLKHIN
ncbi:hypothetical protein [Rhizobium sp.]